MNIKGSLFLLFLIICISLNAKDFQMIEMVSDDINLNKSIDFHILGSIPFAENAVINLSDNEAWLFLDSIRPSVFLEKYAENIKINGKELDIAIDTVFLSENSSIEYTLSHKIKNARVNVFRHGTVIIPHDPELYNAITVYTGKNFEGDNLSLTSNERYYDLSEFDNRISSFKLKRGYMATLANEPNGTGFSRVFIADKEDIEIPILQNELIQKVSFIAVFDWQWVSKKGWCSSGRNAYNELDLTESTWWYSWSADRPPLINQEYVPIKQNSGWPSQKNLLAVKNATHLLGFNEPDRPDQANATVASAINGWPDLMATGLRLGSPAIADNLNWLYSFMDECDKRNFRVDFVAIHAYWGGAGGAYNVLTNGKVDVNKWYNRLKDIHIRTGRPLWITEWNNGANWTNNGEPYWDSDPVKQQLQNKEIMDKVLHMLDTCSFVERYSLYNWVSDRKAAVEGEISQAQIDASSNSLKQSDLGKFVANGWANQRLTPTGLVYKDRYPPLAFNRTNEVFPLFKASKPILKAEINAVSKTVNIEWIDYNGSELSESFLLERNTNDRGYEVLLSGLNTSIVRYQDKLELIENRKLSYRIGVKAVTGEVVYSDPVTINEIIAIGSGDIRCGSAVIGDFNKHNILIAESFDEKPIVVFGGQTHENKTQRSTIAISMADENKVDFYINPWKYVSHPSLNNPETIPFLIAKRGQSFWGGLKTETGSVSNVQSTWKHVSFNQPFEVIPVVFVTSASIMSGIPTAARIQNITKEGFEVRITKERAQSASVRETVNYFAIESGTSIVDDKKISVGVTSVSVGEAANAQEVSFDTNFEDPVFYCGLQTSNDDVTSTIRYNALTNGSVSVLKLKELSAGLFSTELDQVGWMVMGKIDSSSSIKAVTETRKLSIDSNITTDFLKLDAEVELPIEIYSMSGTLMKREVNCGKTVDVQTLPEGLYILSVGNESLRFIKKNNI